MILSEWESLKLSEMLDELKETEKSLNRISADPYEQLKVFAVMKALKALTVYSSVVSEDWQRLGEFSWHETDPHRKHYFVNVYSITRVSGGPEEGGWWYDKGEVIECRLVWGQVQAEATRAELLRKYPRTNKRVSVLGGEDYNVETSNSPGIAFPERTPHYE